MNNNPPTIMNNTSNNPFSRRNKVMAPNTRSTNIHFVQYDSPLISSETSRTGSKYFSNIYQSRLNYIYSKREPIVDGMPHDFENAGANSREFQQLRFFAASQYHDLKCIFEFQKSWEQELWDKETYLIAEYNERLIEELEKIDSLSIELSSCEWPELNEAEQEQTVTWERDIKVQDQRRE